VTDGSFYLRAEAARTRSGGWGKCARSNRWREFRRLIL